MKKTEVARLIDHTLLKPEATSADVAALVQEGAALGTCSVCVSPSMLPLADPQASHRLRGGLPLRCRKGGGQGL